MQGRKSLRPRCHPISLVLPKETGVAPQRKTLLVRVVGANCLLRLCACRGRSSRRRMALLIAGRALLRFARGTKFAEPPGGKGAEPPNNLPPSTPPQTTRTTPRGRALPARRISLARAPSAGGVSSPILPRKMGHFRKACLLRGFQRPKHRNGRPHRAAKIAPGLCLGAIPYLAPQRRNRAAVRREGEPTRGTQSPSYLTAPPCGAQNIWASGAFAPEAHIFFMEGSIRGGPPVPLVFTSYLTESKPSASGFDSERRSKGAGG